MIPKKQKRMTVDYEFDEKTHDHRFEPFLALTPEAFDAVTEHILPECEAVTSRKRKRKKGDEDRFKQTLALVVANGLRASEHPKSKKVYYSRKAETFSGASIYHPPWLRHTNLINAIDALRAAGFLDLTTGENDQLSVEFFCLPRSTFRATDALLERLQQVGITRDDYHRIRNAPVVVLKDGDKKKSLLEYEPNAPKVREIIERVKSYNDFIRQFEISLNVSVCELEDLHAQPEKDGKPRPPTNFKDQALYRVFNNGDWNDGGRWFGAWWQTMPSRYREFILIEGRPTVELDFGGFLTRAIYHEEGINYRDDPYLIEPIADAARAQNMDWESVRGSIKTLTNILINATPTDRIGKFSGLCLPKGYKKPNAVYALIRQRHHRIAHRFQTGWGMRMMRNESDVCEGILMAGKRKGVLVLPIHDSFIVEGRHEDWLRKAMRSSYRSLFGFDPIIKRKESKVVRREDSRLIDTLERDPLTDLSKGERVRDRTPSLTDCRPFGFDRQPTDNHYQFISDQKARLWAQLMADKRNAVQRYGT